MLVLVCFDNGARTLPEVERAGRFGVNVLAAGQEHLARRFASKDDGEVRRGRRTPSTTASPCSTARWPGSAATLERFVPGGDHTIGIGAVHAAELGAPGIEPLIWFRGDYGSL